MTRIKLVSLIIIFAAILSGCSKYGFVNLNYPLDPQVQLPSNIKTIALVNRSLVKTTDKQGKIIEAVFTGEIAGSDKLASDECLKGVIDRSNGYKNITCIMPASSRMYGTGTRKTPELLDWKLVKDICNSNKTDALLVLETFDSNTDLLKSAVTNQVVKIINGQNPKPEVPNEINVNVLTYWRLYDPSSQKIIDQYESRYNMNFSGPVPPADALPNAAYDAGREYIQRLLPSYYTVRRDMYKKGKGSGKQQFKAAFRRAEVANWQGAIDSWKTIVNNGNNNTNAGRACLDIAVAYEVLGETDKAIEWAKKSYEDYNDKLGRNYANILLERRNTEY